MSDNDYAYELAAFGTTIIGVVGLTAGVDTEILSPIVILGARVVGFLNIYWLLDG